MVVLEAGQILDLGGGALFGVHVRMRLAGVTAAGKGEVGRVGRLFEAPRPRGNL